MEGRCAKHQFEASENVCRTCGNEFCSECLVYSFGPKKPPFCIACALAVAGVRTTAGNQPLKPKKEIKKDNKARRKAAKASEKTGAGSVEIEWSMSADPTEGLTEDDLRLPNPTVEPQEPAASPRSEPSPLPPMFPSDDAPATSDDPGGAAQHPTDPSPFERPSVPIAGAPGDPPQMLLRQAEMPPVPAVAPPPPPPPPSPSPLLSPPPPSPRPPEPVGRPDFDDFGFTATPAAPLPTASPVPAAEPTLAVVDDFIADAAPPPSPAPPSPAATPPPPPPPPPLPPPHPPPSAAEPVAFEVAPSPPPPPPPPPPVSEHLLIAEPTPEPAPADGLFGIDGLPPLLQPRESSPLPPPPPLPPASSELGANDGPHVNPDDLFLPSTTVADSSDLSAFGLDDGPVDRGARPTLRVRDLLADPDEAPGKKDEVSFFAPVTPEQLGAERPPEP